MGGSLGGSISSKDDVEAKELCDDANRMFRKVDNNLDGVITKDEWGKAFTTLDENGDGSISRKEWYLKQGTTSIYDAIPKQNPGVIQRQEWLVAFDTLDDNKNGAISLEEWTAIAGGLLVQEKASRWEAEVDDGVKRRSLVHQISKHLDGASRSSSKSSDTLAFGDELPEDLKEGDEAEDKIRSTAVRISIFTQGVQERLNNAHIEKFKDDPDSPLAEGGSESEQGEVSPVSPSDFRWDSSVLVLEPRREDMRASLLSGEECAETRQAAARQALDALVRAAAEGQQVLRVDEALDALFRAAAGGERQVVEEPEVVEAGTPQGTVQGCVETRQPAAREEEDAASLQRAALRAGLHKAHAGSSLASLLQRVADQAARERQGGLDVRFDS